MTVLDVVVLSWLMLGAGVAAWAHRWAWMETPPEHRRARRMHRAIGYLSAVYVAGYAWLLSGTVSVVRWSQIFRGVSLVAFPLVWIAPAVMTARGWQRVRAAAQQIVRAAEEARRG